MNEEHGSEDSKVAEVIDTTLKLSPSTLDYLIAFDREDERLDFKGECDLRKGRKDKVELVRDIFAMSNTEDGGWIVIGVEEVSDASGKRFEPVGMTANAQKLFDESLVRQQVEKFSDSVVRFEIALIASDAHPGKYGLLRVGSASEVPLIMTKDGQYVDAKGVGQTLFRQGDTFVRRGTMSTRANQEDWRQFKSRIRRRERDLWAEETLGLRELTSAIRDLVGTLGEDRVAQPRPPTPEELVAPLEEFMQLFEKNVQ